MATILNDEELQKLIGKVIVDGDISSVRPNSYILRLGGSGEFLNSGKTFSLGINKKGVRIKPGTSVAVTAFETLDFRRETVHQIFPDNDLHGFVSPTTDLSREGIVAPTTQVDAGYHGTLNWTLSNNSNEERRFILKERIFRLTIFKLEKGETPDKIYDGEYQGQTGYVRSQRKGAPVGMKDHEWEDSLVEGGPEELLENLMKSGYPWHALGQRLKVIDQQFKSVTAEYSEIRDSLDSLSKEVSNIRKQSDEVLVKIPETVRSTMMNLADFMQNRWFVGAGAIAGAFGGIILSILTNQKACDFLQKHGTWIGLIVILISIFILLVISKKKSHV